IDIEAGDWVFGLVDNGQATQLQIGTITGTVDVDNDSISGRIYTPWFTQTLYVECHEWAGVGVSGKDSTAGPNGDPPYDCQWTDWDIQPGEEIGVWYVGSDLNWVGNGFRKPQPYLTINKSANGNPAEGGNFVFNINYWNGNDDRDYAENVIITDTLLDGMLYITDTLGFPHTGSGSGPIVWDLGTLPGNSGGNFDVFVQITAAQSDTITNTVQITTSSLYNQSSPGERDSEWSGTVQANDTWLSVGKWIEGRNPAPDTDFTWAANVCNDGSTASSDLTLTDTLPISTTLLRWWGQNPGWTEVLGTSDQLVLSYPSIPGWWCSQVYLRFHLDENAQINMPISNTVTITASNDLAGGSTSTDERQVNGPYSNLYVRKDWKQGQLVPGGDLIYGVQYGNDGNAPADNVWLTYTLPVSTTFNNAWWNDQYGQHPFTPDTVTADYVVWDLGTLENGYGSNFQIRLNVDGGASPGTVLTSTVEITPHPSDYHYDDNAITWAETLNSTGPNLEVHKQNYWWNGTGQIQYEMRVKNRGTDRLEPVWITDTYPISTTWDGNWWYGHGPWITTTHDVPNRQIIFWLESLDPGETASINFQVDLDGAIHGVQDLFFTNTLEAPISGDVYPADNSDQVVAYAGPDVYAEKWLSGGEPHPGEVVTFTVKFGNRNAWPGMDPSYGSYITDTLPPAMEYITATAPWDPNQRWDPDEITGTTSIRWGWGTLWPNDANYFDIVARITDTAQSGDVITNVIEIHNDNPNDVDLFPDNDVFELPVTILDPVFEVGKVYQSSRVAGTVVTYTLTVTNSGNYPGTNVVLSDTVPAYLENVSSGGTLLFDWLWWQLGPIAPYTGTDTAQFNATLPCTAGLDIVNDDYGVRWSDKGVSGPEGDPVTFTVLAPTINAAFTHTLGTIIAGDTVYFTATAGTDGTGLSYEWDFGDGPPASGELTATHVYTQDGAYTVAFTATDTCGYSDVATATVTVNAPNLVANFDYSPKPANILVNATVIFTDTSTTDGPSIVAWAWDFGDNSTPAATQDTSHTYNTAGTYTVTLVVTDTLGYSDDEIKTNVVTVTVACTAVTSVTFDYAPLNPVIQSPVVFTATALPPDATQTIAYAWDLGDGGTGSSRVLSHTYTLSDTYTVIVTATNCSGTGVATHTKDVAVILTEGAQSPIDPTTGGTLVYTDTQGYTTTVEVPGSAITEAITLLYTPVLTPTRPISPNLRFANHTFDLNAYLGSSLLPDFVFSEPVTITIHYSDADVQRIDESSLRLYYWTGSAWNDVINTCTSPSTYTRDPVQNVLGVPICHLTRMGVMGTSLGNIYLPLVLRNS
ncbi:MAG: PKD domain-containing protein, partial [Anaerolineae bacterium]